MVKIRCGARLYYTSIGYKGFHYPSEDNSYRVSEELTADKLTWVYMDKTRVPVSIRLPDDSARVMWVSTADLVG